MCVPLRAVGGHGTPPEPAGCRGSWPGSTAAQRGTAVRRRSAITPARVDRIAGRGTVAPDPGPTAHSPGRDLGSLPHEPRSSARAEQPPVARAPPGPEQAPAPSRRVGRSAGPAETDRFVDAARTGLQALLLSGQAGIGKTSLWKAADDRATERGFRVLVSRPTEVETQLSFAALVDLLDELFDKILPQLPEPQQEALGAALLRVAPGAVPSPLGVSLGVLGAIRAAAEVAPVLIAVDDVPWLDPSSV